MRSSPTFGLTNTGEVLQQFPRDRPLASAIRENLHAAGNAPKVHHRDEPQPAAPSLNELYASIHELLSCINDSWKEEQASRAASLADIAHDLPDDIAAMRRQAEEDAPTDHPSVKKLLSHLVKTMNRLNGAIDWPGCRTLRSQLDKCAPAALGTSARKAHAVLHALDTALHSIRLAQRAEALLRAERHKPVHHRPGNAENTTQCEQRNRMKVIGATLDNAHVSAEESLNAAESALPSKKRRWKLRVLIGIALAVVAVACAVAVAAIPPAGALAVALPLLVPLIKGVGILATVASATHSTLSIFAYTRHKRWDSLAEDISTVRRLHESLTRSQALRNTMEQFDNQYEHHVAIRQMTSQLERIAQTKSAVEGLASNIVNTYLCSVAVQNNHSRPWVSPYSTRI